MKTKDKKRDLKSTNLTAEDIFNAFKEKELPEVFQPFIVGMKLLHLGKILKKKGGDKI